MKSWKSAVRYVLISSTFAALAMSGGARGDDHGLPVTTSPATGADAGQGRLDPGAKRGEASHLDAARASSPAAAAAPVARTSASPRSASSPGATAAPASGISSSWMSEAQRHIREMEYEITWQDKTSLPDGRPAWQAPNRAQNFRSYFTDEGPRLVPRVSPEKGKGWEWGLSLVRYERGARGAAVGEATLSASGNRIDYAHADGGIVETYQNGPEGLEQSFVLDAPPGEPAAGAGRKEPAGLVLELSGDLIPHVATDGQAIDFITPSGVAILHYARLVVTDAEGSEIPARMEGVARAGLRGIRIVIDDAAAVYPLSVDPLTTSPAWTAEGNQAGANFGYSVATAGDVNGDGHSDVIVGAALYDTGLTDAGRSFVYLGTAGGLSSVPAWTADSDQASASFGQSVSTAGDVNGDGYSDVIVGAAAYTTSSGGQGRAYVFLGSASGLSATPGWVVDSNSSGEQFAAAVSAAGDVNGDGYADVIVGGRGFNSFTGRAYVFLGSASGLSTTPDWTVDGPAIINFFGTSVSTAGDVNGDGYSDVIVGASFYQKTAFAEGGAFVYLGSASGLATTPAWSAAGGQGSAQFGFSVSTAGDYNGDGFSDVIVGAPFFDNGQTDEGRAYVYLGSASGLAATPVWTGESNQAGAEYGFSVATAGDVNGDGFSEIIVGAPFYDDPDADEGRAYVYLGSTLPSVPLLLWTAESDQAGAEFGASVATAGDVNGDGFSDIIVGAVFYDDPDTDEGKAYVYLGSASGLVLPGNSSWSALSEQAGAHLGFSVATAGDVNGDGYSDVIVGAPDFDNGEADEGMAFVFLGSATGLAGGNPANLSAAAWRAESDQAGARFGFSVATAGDVNGDGYADVIIGAPFYDNGEADEGRAFVYLGSATGLAGGPNAGPLDAAWTAESDQVGAELGWSVATAGDVNGDGYADVIVGAPLFDNGETDEGSAFVYLGSATGLAGGPNAGPLDAAWTAESDQAGAQFGFSVASAGDVNGDGFSDVIVGANLEDQSLPDEGMAAVYVGSATGLTPLYSVFGGVSSGDFGFSVASAGDVNGDGFSDVIVGAPFCCGGGGTGPGYFLLLLGSSTGTSSGQQMFNGQGQTGDRFGFSVATAGDVNGDGFSDVIVGSPQAFPGGVGTVSVFLGSASGLTTTASFTDSDASPSNLGYSVATAGDVDGDGYADVIFGGPSKSLSQSEEGFVNVSEGNGIHWDAGIRPQQRRADDTAPIAPLGVSDQPNAFRLAVLPRTPFGRGRAKLEWEVKPLGVPFNGTGTQTSASWTDTGTAGTTLDELVSGLASGTPYHWRVRLHYDPAVLPLKPAGPWLANPWSGWQETDLRTPLLAVGDFAWQDLNGDGIQQLGEPGLANVFVAAYDGVTGDYVGSTVSDANGAYQITDADGLLKGHSYFLRFFPPSAYFATRANQGGDDALDSDVDPVTQSTAVFTAGDPSDPTRWDAGFIPFCAPPDQTVSISGMALGPANETILTFQDLNQPMQVTGYNVYRSDTASTAPSTWPQVASDVVDGDAGTPDVQWADTSGDVSPTGIWFYEVTAYNDRCPAEGPF